MYSIKSYLYLKKEKPVDFFDDDVIYVCHVLSLAFERFIYDSLIINAHMLHNLAHVELNAIDMTWDTVARFFPFFDVLGHRFFDDFAHVADDESRHFMWCSQRLAELISLTSLHASASPRVCRPHVSRNTPGLTLYSRFTPSFSFHSVSFTLHRDTVRSRRPLLIASAVKTLGETEQLPILESESIPAEPGVYAVYDKSDELQFVGISRNIAASVSTHLKSVPELCGSVKVNLSSPHFAIVLKIRI